MICDTRVRIAVMRVTLAAILATPLVSGVTDLLTSPEKMERLLRRRFIAATVDGTWNAPLLTEHPYETAKLATPILWHTLAGISNCEQPLVNPGFAGKDGRMPQLRGAVSEEEISDAQRAGRAPVLAVPSSRA